MKIHETLEILEIPAKIANPKPTIAENKQKESPQKEGSEISVEVMGSKPAKKISKYSSKTFLSTSSRVMRGMDRYKQEI